MTLSELRNNKKICETILENEMRILETQRRLAEAGKLHTLAFQDKKVADAKLQVRLYQDRIDEIEEKERQALFDLHQYKIGTENKESVEDSMTHILKRLVVSNAHRQPVNSIKFQEGLTIPAENIDVSLKLLEKNKYIRFETDVRTLGFNVLWLEPEGIIWLEEKENKAGKIIEKNTIINDYSTKNTLEIKNVKDSVIGDMLQNSSKKELKGDRIEGESKDSEKSRTDKIIFKMKNHRVLAPIIVLSIVILAIIGFWNEIEPLASKVPHIFSGNDELNKEKKEFQALDFILEKFNPDTLIKNKSFHAIVSRRGYEMHFIIPNDWDLDEPLDGPAGLRYKSYYLPKNASCVISAYANITCIASLMDSNSTFSLDIDTQKVSYKKLAGIKNETSDEGSCSLENYVDDRLAYAKEGAKEFRLMSKSPSLKMYIENPENSNQIESKRIKYKFQQTGQTHIVMELITYIDEIGLVLQFSAPEKEYLEFEDKFITLTNNTYFKKIQ